MKILTWTLVAALSASSLAQAAHRIHTTSPASYGTGAQTAPAPVVWDFKACQLKKKSSPILLHAASVVSAPVQQRNTVAVPDRTVSDFHLTRMPSYASPSLLSPDRPPAHA